MEHNTGEGMKLGVGKRSFGARAKLKKVYKNESEMTQRKIMEHKGGGIRRYCLSKR